MEQNHEARRRDDEQPPEVPWPEIYKPIQSAQRQLEGERQATLLLLKEYLQGTSLAEANMCRSLLGAVCQQPQINFTLRTGEEEILRRTMGQVTGPGAMEPKTSCTAPRLGVITFMPGGQVPTSDMVPSNNMQAAIIGFLRSMGYTHQRAGLEQVAFHCLFMTLYPRRLHQADVLIIVDSQMYTKINLRIFLPTTVCLCLPNLPPKQCGALVTK